MALTRVEKALSGVFPRVEGWFGHSVTPEKPTAPDASILSQPDLDRFNDWLAKRTDGTLVPTDTQNLSIELEAMMLAYESYFKTPAYVAWSTTDMLSREMQWRLWHVDVAEAVDTKATVPPSTVSSGIGSDAPAVDEIVQEPTGLEARGEAVSTGGLSPEIVFGDDGDIVTTG
jgi:hypothetical protein